MLERKIFDRDLAKNAARAGADLLVRARATGLITDHDTIKGVRVQHLGEALEVPASVVIAADGVESQVGRWAGINTTLKPKDIESCAQYYMTNVDLLEDSCDFYLGSEAPGGYGWVFPKEHKAGNIGLGVLGSRLDGRRSIDYLDGFVERHFPSGQRIELNVGGAPVSNAVSTTVKPGLMLVGDAAHHTDPVTGGGIINALEGGKLAGEVAKEAVRLQDFSLKVLQRYESAWRASFGKTLDRNYRIKEFFVKLSDEDLNKLVHSLEGLTIEEMSVSGLMRRVISRNPRLLMGLRHLF